jgi:DNA-binding GntR family transcriptional regulator
MASEDWSLYSRVKHRLDRLDSPNVNGWTVEELAKEFEVSTTRMRNLLRRLVKDRNALVTDEGGFIGAGL